MRELGRETMKRFDESAQLLILAGFAVGVGIVVLTIMLNNVIYASNIASESSIDTSRNDIENAISMTTEAYEDAYRSATEAGPFNNTIFEQYLNGYEEMAARNYAIAGLTFNLDNNTLHEAYMTKNGLFDGEDDWIIVRNVNTTDVFLFEVNDTSTLGNSSNSFMITITNSTGLLWSVELYNSSGNINITVTDQSSVIEQHVATSQINVTGDMKDYTVPASFQFDSHTSGNDYSINIINGSNVIAYCTLNGTLTTGEPFTFARYFVAKPTITMHSREMSITRDIPTSLPGRVS